MSKIPVKYHANNSGGRDWLTTKDWKKLRDAGWLLLDWDNEKYGEDGNALPDKNGLPTITRPAVLENTHYAWKKFNTIQEAIAEFEELTGADVTDEGCNCCGAPHAFTWGKDVVKRIPIEKQDYHYASGEDLLKYIFPDRPIHKSKRELLESL